MFKNILVLISVISFTSGAMAAPCLSSKDMKRDFAVKASQFEESVGNGVMLGGAGFATATIIESSSCLVANALCVVAGLAILGGIAFGKSSSDTAAVVAGANGYETAKYYKFLQWVSQEFGEISSADMVVINDTILSMNESRVICQKSGRFNIFARDKIMSELHKLNSL